MSSDPVHYDADKDGWFFWCECWMEQHGPFGSESDARQALAKYADGL